MLAIVLIALSWWGIFTAQSGLEVRFFERDGVPLLYVAPENSQAAPGVLVAHGFAGSKQLMLSYGYVLAHAGYAVMLWDFDGHGANATPLRRFDLQQNLQVALQALVEQPGVDAAKLALLGHSMGGSVVLSAGIQSVDRFAATIAISSSGAAVTSEAPRNLQLQVGAWEGRLLPYAERVLNQAGDANSQFAAGRARELTVIPNVEHITILFNSSSHQAAVRWLDATFQRQTTSSYVDRRMIWYFLHVFGWLIGLSVIAPIATQTVTPIKVPITKRIAGLVGSAIVAIGGLVGLSTIVNLQALGGVQVGGAVGIWFLLAGLVWLAILRQVPRLSWRSAVLGVGLFALLWIAIGIMAQIVWLQWWLILPRLRIWLPIAIACLPWFLASGMVQQNAALKARVAWWLGQSATLIGAFLAVVLLVPGLGFMFLLLPLFPVVIGLFSFVAGLVKNAWIYAIASALLFAWLLAAGFPLSAGSLQFS